MPLRCSSCVCVVLAVFIFPVPNSAALVMFFSVFFYMASLPFEKGKSSSSLSHAASSTSPSNLRIFILSPLCWPSAIPPSPFQPVFTVNPVLTVLTCSALILRSHLELTGTTSGAVSAWCADIWNTTFQSCLIQLLQPAWSRYSLGWRRVVMTLQPGLSALGSTES